MNTTTLALVLAAAAVAAGTGCSKKKAATTTPIAAAPVPAAETTVPPEKLQQDEVVSPGLAVATDLLSQCGIKAIANPNPSFDYDQYDLGPDDRTILDQIATCLTTGPLKGKGLELVGRADPRGTEEYNLGLGSRRAASVGQYLGRLGVMPTQLAVTTRGALDAAGSDEASWRQDRRVDVQLR